MKTIFQFLALFLCCLALFTLSHCSSDDEGDTDEINLNDPNAVTDAITIAGASVNDGSPPAPSTDPDAPTLFDTSGEDVISIQGESAIIDLDVSSGNAAGIYLQIEGADTYYDIPASAFAGGRVDQFVDPAVEIQLPENIQPGEFCADVCIYDAELRVSNIVNICITINQLGGANSDFLIGVWNVTQIVEVEDGISETITIGEVDEFTYTLQCDFNDVTITESEFYEFIRLTFSANGAMRFESEYEDIYFSFFNANCEAQYVTDSGIDDETGGWSYDSSTNNLVFIINFVDEDGDVDQDVVDLTISVSGNTMTAVQDYGFGDTDTITLVKQ